MAGPLSPLKPPLKPRFPGSRHGGDHPVRDLADAAVASVGDVEVAGGVHGDAGGEYNWALVAGPLSPLKPGTPFPATVVITPFETLRMRRCHVGDVEVAGGVHGDAVGLYNMGAGGRTVVAAEADCAASRHGGDHPVRDLADADSRVRDVEVAGGVHGDAGVGEIKSNWALVAGPLSPLKP